MRTLICWLFVRVIDNYGDIGVTWRMAREMSQRLNMRVSIWVDDWHAFFQLLPEQPIYNDLPIYIDGVKVHHWHDMASIEDMVHDPDVVIEMFGCQIPDWVVRKMLAQHIQKTIWLNWEYLTAEQWAVEYHGMYSLQPNGLKKYFWFMGFDEKSGGLLREQNYPIRRKSFLSDIQQQENFRQQYQLPERKESCQVGLIFSYHSKHWHDWLLMLQHSGQTISLWLAGSQIIESLWQAGILPQTELVNIGDCFYLGNIQLFRLPFVPQSEFDYLLWSVDWAVVRGEDSFVRAQLAGIPFFWHIYPQDDQAHHVKLQAFWQEIGYFEQNAELQQYHQLLSDDLNDICVLTPSERQNAWQQLWRHSRWQDCAARWSMKLEQQTDALERLAIFIQDRLECRL